MNRCWVIAPAEYRPAGEKAAWYRTCWQYDLANGIIAIGWGLGEAPESRAHLEFLWELYAGPTWTGRGRRMVEQFYFEIEEGDLIIARAGLSRYVGYGEFRGDAFYDEKAEGQTWGCNHRRVRWEPERGMRRSPVRFTQNTVYLLSEDKARLFNAIFPAG